MAVIYKKEKRKKRRNKSKKKKKIVQINVGQQMVSTRPTCKSIAVLAKGRKRKEESLIARVFLSYRSTCIIYCDKGLYSSLCYLMVEDSHAGTCIIFTLLVYMNYISAWYKFCGSLSFGVTPYPLKVIMNKVG